VSILSFKQGVHPDYNKELTADKPLKKAKRPEQVVIPLQQHIGAPLEPLVKKGDHVEMGQKIGDSESFVSAPVHASVSGKVKDIKKVMTPGGSKAQAIVIAADAEDNFVSDLQSHADLEQLSGDEIRNIVRNAGIVGMGGAMFPTHVKLSIPKEKNVEYVILNGAECEPYLTIDNRIMIERPEDVLFGLKAIMKAVGVEKGFIGIEVNKPEAIAAMEKVTSNEGNIEVKILETKYPQGGEKMLVEAILGREVPAGGLPLDVGVVVNNTSTSVAIADAIQKGIPLIERAVSITGHGIAEPQNLIFRVGTLVNELIEQAGGFAGKPGKVILGGPMMGFAQKQLDIPMVKGSSGILVLTKEEVDDYEPSPCIKCARCVDACPVFLMPTQLMNYSKNEMLDELEDYQIMSCIECGSCSYVCPAKIPLVHHLRMGKAQVQARQREER